MYKALRLSEDLNKLVWQGELIAAATKEEALKGGIEGKALELETSDEKRREWIFPSSW